MAGDRDFDRTPFPEHREIFVKKGERKGATI
jgi:hypothetical protein